VTVPCHEGDEATPFLVDSASTSAYPQSASGILAFAAAATGAPSTTRFDTVESPRSPIVPAELTEACTASAVISPPNSDRPETAVVTLAVPSGALAVALTEVDWAETTEPSGG
jgi:hypothetical protein